MDAVQFLLTIVVTFGAFGFYAAGHRAGVQAEKRRTADIFAHAGSVVRQGALEFVRRAYEGDITLEQMREELREYVRRKEGRRRA